MRIRAQLAWVVSLLLTLAAGSPLALGQSSSIASVVDLYSGSTLLCPGDLALVTLTSPLPGRFTLGGVVAPEIGAEPFFPTRVIEIPINAPAGISNLAFTTALGATSPAFPLNLAAYAWQVARAENVILGGRSAL